MNDDYISHPDHYCAGRKFEPKDVIRDWGLNYNLGCAVKYISRAGRKDDILVDLKKARQYLDFEIEAIGACCGYDTDLLPEAPFNSKKYYTVCNKDANLIVGYTENEEIAKEYKKAGYELIITTKAP